MIIDTHVHIFPERIAEKAVQNIGHFYDIHMTGDGRISNLIESMRRAGVTVSVVCSVATSVHQVRAINNFIAEVCKNTPKLIGLISLHPSLELSQVKDEIAFALDNGMVGIKLHPDFQQFNIDDPKMDAIYNEITGVLPILFHTGDPRYDYSSPVRLANVAKRFPNLKCIAAHMGGYEKWNLIKCFMDTPNVYFDTSSSMFKLSGNQMRDIINMFGSDRFMWGSDFPMWNMEQEIARLNALNLSEEMNAKIFYKNAVNFYGLDMEKLK